MKSTRIRFTQRREGVTPGNLSLSEECDSDPRDEGERAAVLSAEAGARYGSQ